MRMKKLTVKCMALALTCAVLTASCACSKKKTVKVLSGDPDKENVTCDGVMFPQDEDDLWVEDAELLGMREEKQACEGDKLTLQVFFSDKVYKKHDLKKTGKIALTARIFEYNKKYEWEIKDALVSASGKKISREDVDTGETSNGLMYFLELDDFDNGKYTIVLSREDGVVECMADFKVVSEKEIETTPLEVEEKPVIYLYPEKEMDVSVTLDLEGRMTCSYPEYGNGWNVTAYPGGKILDKGTSRYYDYLFWEGEQEMGGDVFEKAACVASEDTAAFLEEYLAASGLNDSEIDDFISYWLPKLQASPYNLISFPNEKYNEWAKLNVVPAPDTEIRVYMVFKPLDEAVEIPEDRALTLPERPDRKGFTVVEWGGTQKGA